MENPTLISGAQVDSLFIGAGCNRFVNSASWGLLNLVAFGVHRAVAIFDPQDAKILTTLSGHEDIVSCVEWLPKNKDAYREIGDLQEHYLLSGSVDGAIIIWGYMISDGKWRQALQVPEKHQKAVTCITSYMRRPSNALFASTSSDGTVCIWEVCFPAQTGGGLELSLLQKILVGAKTMVAVSLTELPGVRETCILAMGGLDNKVHLYVREEKAQFVCVCELKGHQEWIRGLDFSIPIISLKDKHILLASSSQDKTLRIWKISLQADQRKEESLERISLKTFIEGPAFKASGYAWQVSLESLLVGHEDWVYSVKWQPPAKNVNEGVEDNWVQPQSVLSASMDKTMMIWRPESKSGIWVNQVTVGELSHSALGFYGGHWSPKGDSVLAHGYAGSFHLWKNVGFKSEEWKPQLVPSGHSAPVVDLAWAKSNQFILTASHDQTTRIFAPWERKKDEKIEISWHEVARPQVHGHDINGLAITKGEGNHQYVSGADEKVARVFEAPLSFLQTLQYTAHGGIAQEIESEDIQILGANMSALGLSQKPIFLHGQTTVTSESKEDGADFMDTVPDAIPVVLKEPPLEEDLAWHTLWPETHKLYGHGNELFAMCCDHQGKLIATACKAQTPNVAEIWLWSVGSWRAVGRIPSHSLTVTQMEFSSDDCYLLSVSRDRHFSVIQLEQKDDVVGHKIIARQDAHKRIIWSCSWKKGAYVFATGSRDKTVKIWNVENVSEKGRSVNAIAVLPQFSGSVTAVSWAPPTEFAEDLLAVGMENGRIELWKLDLGSGINNIGEMQSEQTRKQVNVSKVVQFDSFVCHVAAIHRLVWKENLENSKLSHSSSQLQLASCGADNTVRLFDVSLV
eukprot:TRINITY_DN9322_c0_g3_i1.p1 TRINITY_DN9322_c0_g3~~TRINITY_DN9322_c0_g3_i1.p1  ORF type:complete len:854 (-),score=210.17 TRINITY_DN9322_c0_g3_i1:1-2562(-)